MPNLKIEQDKNVKIAIDEKLQPYQLLLQGLTDEIALVKIDNLNSEIEISRFSFKNGDVRELSTSLTWFQSRSEGSYRVVLVSGMGAKSTMLADEFQKSVSDFNVDVKFEKIHGFQNLFVKVEMKNYVIRCDFMDMNPALDFEVAKSDDRRPGYATSISNLRTSASADDASETSSSSEDVKPKSARQVFAKNTEIYELRAGQTAIVDLANQRTVQCDLKYGVVVFVVFDLVTRTVAISMLSNGIDKVGIEKSVMNCLMPLKERSKNLNDKWGYLILCAENDKPQDSHPDGISPTQSSVNVLASLKSVIDQETGEKFGFKLEKLKTAPLKAGRSFVQIGLKSEALSITSSDVPATSGEVIGVSASELGDIKSTDNHDPKNIKFKDLLSMHDSALNIELVPNMGLDVDLSRNHAFIRLRDKTIVLYRFCAHTRKLAVLQLSTKDFTDGLAAKALSKGHVEALKLFTNSPFDAKSPAAPMFFLACKEPRLGHTADSEACDTYIKYFDANYQAFVDAQSKNQGKIGKEALLHSLAKPQKVTFKIKDEKQVNFLSFWFDGKTLQTLVGPNFEQSGVSAACVPKNAQEWGGFYQSIGVETVASQFNSSEKLDGTARPRECYDDDHHDKHEHLAGWQAQVIVQRRAAISSQSPGTQVQLRVRVIRHGVLRACAPVSMQWLRCRRSRTTCRAPAAGCCRPYACPAKRRCRKRQAS